MSKSEILRCLVTERSPSGHCGRGPIFGGIPGLVTVVTVVTVENYYRKESFRPVQSTTLSPLSYKRIFQKTVPTVTTVTQPLESYAYPGHRDLRHGAQGGHRAQNLDFLN